MRAKKSLGQNFLNSQAAARDIVAAGNLSQKDTVIEIGPGKGFLTKEILKTGAHVIAVEKDDRMIPLLSEMFTEGINQKQLTLIHGDIVELLSGGDFIPSVEYKVIANIPYYITGYILRAFLEHPKKPSQMILMVQKEVANRIVARDKKESILSISVKAYGVPKIIKKVPARYFTPAPKVDSAVLAIDNISGKNFPDKETQDFFFQILKAGFAHKRKKITGNLSGLLGPNAKDFLTAIGISPDIRSEDLTLDDWFKIERESSREMQHHNKLPPPHRAEQRVVKVLDKHQGMQ